MVCEACKVYWFSCVLCFSAGVGRAGTFCVIYTAIRELNGTGNIGKDGLDNTSYSLGTSVSVLSGISRI